MGKYNLLDESWIPVLRNDTGAVENVSLLTFFEHAQEYRALAGEMETQNFAVLRVLLAVLITVFTRVDQDGEPYEWLEIDATNGKKLIVEEPVDEMDADDYLDALDETWKAVWNEHRFPAIVNEYLEAWRDRFYLLDNTYPFFQVTKKELIDRLPSGKGASAVNAKNFSGKQMNRLISESNHKEALFAPFVGKHKNCMTVAELIRWLITLQGYVGIADKIKFPVNGKVTNSKGWLYDIGGIYMAGDDLFETLWINTLLHHPADERYSLSPQTPCWEDTPAKRLEMILKGNIQTNLASLYTAWGRAIYIPTEWTEEQEVSIGAVKVPEINHENNFLEPMTVWSFNTKGKHINKFIPRTHRPEQSLWRSFGLLIPDENNVEAKRPIIIDYYHEIKSFLNNRMVELHAVSMLSDGDEKSWLPIDEVTDILSFHEIIVTDIDGDGWGIRVRNTAEDTKAIIEQTYRPFLKKTAKIREIDRSDFVENQISELYGIIDIPFRDWLCSIYPNDNKDSKVRIWKLELRHIILDAASSIMAHLSARDYLTRDKEKKNRENIIVAYKIFKYELNKKIPPEIR